MLFSQMLRRSLVNLKLMLPSVCKFRRNYLEIEYLKMSKASSVYIQCYLHTFYHLISAFQDTQLYLVYWYTHDYRFTYNEHLLSKYLLLSPFYTPARRESGVYRDPHVRPSVRHTFGFRIIIKVPLNQICSNFQTMLWTIKYRLSSITVYFTFTVPELWSFFS